MASADTIPAAAATHPMKLRQRASCISETIPNRRPVMPRESGLDIRPHHRALRRHHIGEVERVNLESPLADPVLHHAVPLVIRRKRERVGGVARPVIDELIPDTSTQTLEWPFEKTIFRKTAVVDSLAPTAQADARGGPRIKMAHAADERDLLNRLPRNIH